MLNSPPKAVRLSGIKLESFLHPYSLHPFQQKNYVYLLIHEDLPTHPYVHELVFHKQFQTPNLIEVPSHGVGPFGLFGVSSEHPNLCCHYKFL